MNPPANASSENSADSRRTTLRERPSPSRRADPVVGGSARAAAPRPPGPRRQATDGHDQADQRVPDDDRAVGVEPRPARAEQGLAEQPRRQGAGRGRDVARRGCTRRRSRSGGASGRSGSAPPARPPGTGPPRCRSARSRRRSPARISTGSQVVVAKTSPAITTRRLPTISTRRRPSRSACVVSHSETSVSPTSVSVRTAPIARGSRPIAARYSTSTTARKPYPNIRSVRSANSARPSRSEAAQAGDERRRRLACGRRRVASLGVARRPAVCHNARR